VPTLAAEPVTEKPVKVPKATKAKAEKVPKAIEVAAEATSTIDAAPKAEGIEKVKPARKAPKPTKTAKPVDLAASGLQLVETKGDAKPAPVAAEPAKLKAPRKAPNWKKDAEAKTADAPLVMVETQK
jgi:ribonuclease E